MNPSRLRSCAVSTLRQAFSARKIEEAWTPLLVPSGAMEPYLDTFSVASAFGHRAFLPTSPEFGLKKAFAFSDGPGIYEIAHAFRDEERSRLHAPEFTMVEWYLRSTAYRDLPGWVEYLLRSLSASACSRESRSFSPITVALPTLYENLLGHSFPESQERFQDEFLQIVEPWLATQDLLCLYDFPAYARGMAKLNSSGHAQRVECYLNGLEIANGYQELDSKDETIRLWEENNALRISQGKDPHPIDETLAEISHRLGGVSGIAMGLERVIMGLWKIPHIKEFER